MNEVDFKIAYNGPQFEGTSELIETDMADPPLEVISGEESEKEGSGEEQPPIFACRLCNHYALQEEDVLKHLLLQHEKIVVPGSNYILNLRPLQPSEIEHQISVKEQISEAGVVHLQLIKGPLVEDTNESRTGSQFSNVVNKKRRRGRPRKEDAQKQTEESEKISCMKRKQKDINVPSLLSADGFYRCDRCNRSFRKERQIRGHRCFAFDPKLDDNSNGESQKINIVSESKVSVSVDEVNDVVSEEESEDLKGDGDDDHSKSVTNKSKCIPAFCNEEEQVAFKKRLNAVDLKCVDHLYSKHFVEQQIKNVVVGDDDDDDTNKTKLRSQKCKQLQIFSCNVCSKVFKSVSHIRLHCLVHTDLKPFRCTECSYSTNTKGNLYTHVRKHTGNSYNCSQCDFRSCNRSHVTEHEATHSVRELRHKCRICKNNYRTFKSLGNHVRKYHLEDRDYVASFCSSKFTGNLLHECQICHRKFKKKIDKERHLHLHSAGGSSQNVLGCELCSYETYRTPYLQKHFRRHRLIYCCCRCSKKFLSVFTLKLHLRSEHTSVEMYLTESLESSWFLDESQLFDDRCSVDEVEKLTSLNNGASSNNETVVDEGSNTVDEVLRMIKQLKYKRMSAVTYDLICKTFGKEECEVCGCLFQSVDELFVHKRCHVRETPFKCSKCSYSAATSSNLKRHVETFHEQRSFVCDKCHQVSRSRTSLWQHQQKHKTFYSKCDKCDKMFKDPTKLRQHIDFVHSSDDYRTATAGNNIKHISHGLFGRRSLKCPHCDRVFHRSISDLKKHIWIHEGIKPFKCSVCSYSCRSRNNLNVHMLRHSDDKPEHCVECGRSYKSKAALRWHQKMHEKSCSDTRRNHLKRQFVAGRGDITLNNIDIDVNVTSSNVSIDNSTESVTNDETVTLTRSEDSKLYNCFNCDSYFEGLSDMTHHLKVKHNLPSQNLSNLKLTELQLVNEVNERKEETEIVPSAATVAAAANESSLMATNYEDTEILTSATVNVIRQIIDQGGLETGHITLHAVPDGLQLEMNPEAFIIRDDDGRAEVVVGGSLEDFAGNELNGTTLEEFDHRSNEYTIQFVTEPMNEFGDPT